MIPVARSIRPNNMSMRRGQNDWQARARMSQAWLNAPLLVLVVFIVKLMLLKSFITSTMDIGIHTFEIDCAAFHSSVNEMINIPVQIATTASKLVDQTIDQSIQGVLHMIENTISIIESLLMFAFELTIGSYACLTIGAVNIGANEALNATEFIIREANKTVKSIESDLQHGLTKLSSFVNGAIGLVNTVDDFISGGDADIRDVNLTISRLGNWSLPSTINSDLESLRGKIITYDGTKEAVKNAIDVPFKALRNEVKSFSAMKTNLSFSPVADLQNTTLLQCNITKAEVIFDEMRTQINTATGVFCALCVIALVAGALFNTFLAQRRWQTLAQLASSLTSSAPEKQGLKRDALDRNIESIISHMEDGWVKRKLLARIPEQFRPTARYIFSAQLTGVLFLGLAGIVISAMELIVLNTLAGSLAELGRLEKGIENNTCKMAASIYQQWQAQTNAHIGRVEKDINSNVLGWVHSSSKSVNSTISTFSGSINKEINTLFNGTILQTSLRTAANCLFMNKIREAETGLTWLYNHSSVTLPRVNKAVFTSTGAAGSAANSTFARFKTEASSTMRKALTQEKHQIKIQLLVSGALIALWIVFAVSTFILVHTSWENWTKDAKPKEGPFPYYSMRSNGIKRNRRPTPVMAIPVPASKVDEDFLNISQNSGTLYRSGGRRATAVFDGPARMVGMSSVVSPKQGIISKLNTPRTPLPAFVGQQRFP